MTKELVWTDSFFANVAPKSWQEKLAALKSDAQAIRERGFAFPEFTNFPSIENVRRDAELADVRQHAVVSLSTHFRKANTGFEYFSVQGWGSIGEYDPEAFFQYCNKARLDLTNQKIEELWYCMVAGHFPDLLIPSIARYAHLFDGLKIGAARPIRLNDERYDSLFNLAQDLQWPVLIHCSGESDSQDFIDVCEIAEKRRELKCVLSHMGGMKQRGEKYDQLNLKALFDRSEYLQDNYINNVYLNTAVYDLQLVELLIDKHPEMARRILIAMDIPFFGDAREAKSRYLNLTTSTIEHLLANTSKFLKSFREPAHS
jgi:hypothetical protein